jgi:sec-independent protein translocase protein TatC
MIRLRPRRSRSPDGRMTIVEHLEELRYRLILAILFVVAATIVAWVYYPHILTFLVRPLFKADPRIRNVYVTSVVAGFLIRAKVSLFAGLIFALPAVLWQFWRFITPGLEPSEKRFAIPFVLCSLGLFALGGWFAFLILKPALKFLLGFNIGPIRPLLGINQYLGFVMLMVLAFGLSFEYPLVLVFLAGVGILSSERLRRWRRYAFFLAFVVGAVATPSQDPYSMTLMAVPLYILYEITILVIRFALGK